LTTSLSSIKMARINKRLFYPENSIKQQENNKNAYVKKPKKKQESVDALPCLNFQPERQIQVNQNCIN